MTIDERIDRLVERHEALAQSVELLTANVTALTESVRKHEEMVRKHEANWDRLRRVVTAAMRAGLDELDKNGDAQAG